ncbi:hypothetical protein [Nocardia rosealba]|uniref:hypothetical protein n=1 Tax=Nocardia rosealba TaxID=2878563 RepID=UPI001CD977D9|nr:hypothetical protein [Nocardia rosealba]MCA2206197.1 hypothetical protein [Nocardia rosealba]
MSPQIPPMPTPPKPDSGAGGHGSQPIYSRADDLIFFNVALRAQLAADAAGLTHAAAGMRHYLANSGDDFTISPDEAMNDLPGLKDWADKVVTHAVSQVANNPANHNQTVAFTSEWLDYYISQEASQDWFLAMAGVEVSATGVVTTTPAESGGRPRISMSYQVHLFDRYNWDGGKAVEILGIEITDARMGALHTAGLAKEFDQYGTSTAQQFEGELPVTGTLDLPGPAGGRGGTRSDPSR